MKAKELLQEGSLSLAVRSLNEDVRSHPADINLRIFFFEVLCFAEEYDRASRQLDVVSHLSASNEVGVEVYRNLLQASRARRQLYLDGVLPEFLSEPPSYVQMHLEALNALREKQFHHAKSLLAQSSEMRFPLSGHYNGQVFSDVRDADDVLAPILEVFSNGKYFWLPFEHIRRITMAPPKFLRDLLWRSATIATTQNTSGEVFIPVLYFGSSVQASEQVALGRVTDWKLLADEIWQAVGQRMFIINDDEQGFLETRELEIDGIDGQGHISVSEQ